MQCDAAKKGKLLDSAFWNVMNDIFTLILPVDRLLSLETSLCDVTLHAKK